MYQIDQSGKIEDTAKNTIICIANGQWDAIIIPTIVKRRLQKVFRTNGKTRNFILFTFAAGLSILLKRKKEIGSVLIDQEYLGHERTINKLINEMNSAITVTIRWGLIGKQAHAHDIAAKIAHKKLVAKKKVTFNEIWKEIKETEVGKRLKDT